MLNKRVRLACEIDKHMGFIRCSIHARQMREGVWLEDIDFAMVVEGQVWSDRAVGRRTDLCTHPAAYLFESLLNKSDV